MIRSLISDLFNINPCIDTAGALEYIKSNHSTSVRPSLLSNGILKEQVKKIVGADLSYHRNYLKSSRWTRGVRAKSESLPSISLVQELHTTRN